MSLTLAQLAALNHINRYARSRREAARETIDHILKMSNVDRSSFDAAAAAIAKSSRVALHFHPDRLDPEMRTVASALLEQGEYKSQFETKLSSGSVSALPGGERDLWEKRLYGGAYHSGEFDSFERPKYGALDLMRHGDGPAPRFGSCFFMLKTEVSRRCTFTYLDSHRNPDEKGTLEEFEDILGALLTETFMRGFALGEPNLTVPKLVSHLSQLNEPLEPSDVQRIARNLDFYIEAQVHGRISLAEDVENCVCDPSFRGTAIGKTVEELAEKYDIELSWHSGFSLRLDQVPSDFRGPSMPSLARRIASGPFLDAATIGTAAFELRKNPEDWADRGLPAEVIQELKMLWHVLLKFGNTAGHSS